MSAPRDGADRGELTGAPLPAAYDGVICDLDGVVYRGDEPVPGAPEALQDIVVRGTRVVYATNNASRVPSVVAAQVAGLGAPATPHDVVTSAQAGAELLRTRMTAGARVLALGGPGAVDALTECGLRPVAPVDVDTGVSAVLQGLGRDLTVGDFEAAARALTAGIPWVATNTDSTLPMPWGLAPGNGAYVSLLTTATGRRPEVVGKPFAPLYRLALARLGSTPSRTLAIGDRLETDIAGARAAGVHSAWVLTGVDRPSDVLRTNLTPTFVVASLGELLGPYAVPTRREDGWLCGAAVARLDGDRLDLRGPDGARIELVRAGLAALLEARDGGIAADHLAGLAEPLDGLADELLATAR